MCCVKFLVLGEDGVVFDCVVEVLVDFDCYNYFYFWMWMGVLVIQLFVDIMVM